MYTLLLLVRCIAGLIVQRRVPIHMIGFGLEAGARGIQNAKVWHQIHGNQKCDRPALPCVAQLLGQ